MVKKSLSILEACKFVGIKVPRFCYHENLSIAGNCRMCLVEVEKSLKPITSCSAPILPNQRISTKSPLVLKARENILESLLINHPLDCPICDQGGECDLQDHARIFGSNLSRWYFNSRGIEDHYCGPLIKTILNRCILCTRCVRFNEEIVGVKLMGTLNRGLRSEIGKFIKKNNFSGITSNVVDLCPVGALTIKPYSFQVRPWEIKSVESIDLLDGLGGNIYFNYKGLDIVRVLPKKNKSLNESWISDKARFGLCQDNFKRVKTFKNISDRHNFSFLFKLSYITLLVSDELCLEYLNIFKQIAFLSRGRVKVKTLTKNKNISNIYFWGNKAKVSDDIQTKNGACLILSSNLNVECVLLNTRLKVNFLKQKVKTYELGNIVTFHYPNTFLKLGLADVLNVFSNKNYYFRKLFFNLDLFIIYGRSIENRVDLSFLNILKKKNLHILSVQTRCNAESKKLLNIGSVTKKTLLKSEKTCVFLLEDTYDFRKKVLKSPRTRVEWFNPYPTSARLIKRAEIFQMNFFLNGSTFLNLEQRPQKFSLIFNKNNSNTNTLNFYLKNFLEALAAYYINSKKFKINIFNKTRVIVNKRNSFLVTRPLLFSIFREVLLNPELFNKKLLLMTSYNYDFWCAFKNNFSKYPLKLIVEDFFRTNNATNNSFVLAKCSQELRKEEFSISKTSLFQ